MESFCTSLVFKDPAKIQAFFKELFLNQIVLNIKKCGTYEKREKFVKMIYYFYPNDPKSHHEAIKIYKEKLDNIEIFMQSLAIFIKEEVELNDNNRVLIRDFKHYAKVGLSSLKNSIKLSSLYMMSHLATLNHEWVQKHILFKLDQFTPHDWWEVRCMFLIVVSRILHGMSESEPYKMLIKKQNQNFRAYNPDHELLVANMREIIDKLSNRIKLIFDKNYNEYVYRVALIYFADMLKENRNLVDIYVNLLLNSSQDIRIWALYNSETGDDVEEYFVYNDKSLKYQTYINTDALKNASEDILSVLADRMKKIERHQFEANYLDILIFCFENADFQKLNVEVFDSLINNSLDHLIYAMNIESLCKNAAQILEGFLDFVLKEEVMIQDYD